MRACLHLNMGFLGHKTVIFSFLNALQSDDFLKLDYRYAETCRLTINVWIKHWLTAITTTSAVNLGFICFIGLILGLMTCLLKTFRQLLICLYK